MNTFLNIRLPLLCRAACLWICVGIAMPLAAAQVDLARKPATPSAITPPASTSSTDMADLIRLYEADRNSVGRFYDLPWSGARIERTEKLTAEWKQRLLDTRFDALDQQGRIDYLLLRNELASESTRLELERQRIQEMEPFLPFRSIIQNLEQTRWQMDAIHPQKSAEAISVIPDQIKKLRKRIEKGRKDKPKDEPAYSLDKTKDKPSLKDDSGPALKISPALARRTASAIGDLQRTLKTWSGFYNGFVPDFTWWVKKPHDEAQTALEDYAKFLREEIAGLKGKDEDPLIGDPIGATTLLQDLATEMIPYTPEELIAIGEAEFAWCEARMKEAARQMKLGADWKTALARVKTGFAAPGTQDTVIAAKARAAIQFVKERNLVTVPPLAEELWRLSMISPEGQKTLPYAAYSGPNMLVAYAKDEMKHEDKMMSMRGNNPHFMHIVTPHELIPGHHLQRFMSDRHRPYRGLFNTPFYVEGWSLHWEMLLWDLNYGQTPEDRIGMLFWRMHRCARIIVSLKFHLGQMTPAEMVDFIVDRVGHERLGATSEVRRFIGGDYSPLYQCGYMIGGLQLRALRKELIDAGRTTDRQFNDTVLTYGPIPIEFIRAGMLKLPLTRDTQPSWKFAGEKPGAK